MADGRFELPFMVGVQRPTAGRVTPCAPSYDPQPTVPSTTLAAGRGLPALPGVLAKEVTRLRERFTPSPGTKVFFVPFIRPA